jgi:SPP1 family predicted phage head-tail adaptor
MRTDMRSKLTFRSRSATQNGYGEEIIWTNVQTVWGSVEPLLGKELFAAETINSNIQIKFRCMYFSGVTAEMRIQYNGIEYEILSAVNVKNLNREWLFYSKRVDA